MNAPLKQCRVAILMIDKRPFHEVMANFLFDEINVGDTSLYTASICSMMPNKDSIRYVVSSLLEQNKADVFITIGDTCSIVTKEVLDERGGKPTIFVGVSNPVEIGLVDSNMRNIGIKKDGISHQEKTYISAEVASKNAESLLWGTMMGPFGGCFALRKKLWEKIPSHFLVDDFFINMLVLQKGFKSINEPNAIVFEDVSNDLSDEFRRKIRISSGNFQNLFHYKHLLFDFSWIAFSFFSHKVLRWLTPFFILSIISN
jgi:cellulose synthase/poly-beta-1,6-N-acetylglucosamine synthase-like glycosyltransferase